MIIFSQAQPDDLNYQLNLERIKFKKAVKNNEDFESLKIIKQKINELEKQMTNKLQLEDTSK